MSNKKYLRILRKYPSFYYQAYMSLFTMFDLLVSNDL